MPRRGPVGAMVGIGAGGPFLDYQQGPGGSHPQESIRWHAYAVIERFSPDQCAWADRQVRNLVGWYRPSLMSLVRRQFGGEYQLTLSEMLRRTGDPEDGICEERGNLLTTAGLTAITSLLVGNAAANGKYSLSPTGLSPGCGVGSGTTTATVSDTKLTSDNTANAYYQVMDATFPSVAAGVLSGQSTFASGNANFGWNEWCWTSGNGALTAGDAISTIYATNASYAMWNHKVPSSSLGTKASGAAWVFSTTITLS